MTGHAIQRAGFSLAEVLLGMALLGLLAAMVAAIIRTTERAASRQMDGAEAAETVRIATAVLGAELRYIDPAHDLAAVSSDSVAIRAFRGIAFVCAAGPGADVVAVGYRGVREPEPAKDSVLVAGTTWPLALAASGGAGGACEVAPGERVYRWTLLGSAPPVGAALILFERGSYHLAGDAFRYRRGLGGRQPLTAERLDTRQSGIRAVNRDGATASGADAAALLVDLVVDPRVRGVRSTIGTSLRIPLVNGAWDRQAMANP